jgi:hypothetical protein
VCQLYTRGVGGTICMIRIWPEYRRVLLLLSVLLLIGNSGTLRSQVATISLLPSPEQIEVDSVVMIVVEVSNVEHLHAYSVDVSYDTGLVHFLSLQRLPFFNGTTFFASLVDSASGKIVVNEAILGASGQSGTGGLAMLRFVGVRPGVASFQITASALRDTVNASIPVNNVGTTVTVGKSVGVKGAPPAEEKSSIRVGNYPNPFNSTTTILYTLPESGNVRIELLNVLGETVRSLGRMYLGKGEHRIQWDGRDNGGQSTPSGVIFVRIEVGKAASITKMLLLR